MSSPKLLTFRDLLQRYPYGERTMRSIVSDLGISCPSGRGRLLFDERVVKLIDEAVICRPTIAPAKGAVTPAMSSAGASAAQSVSCARRAQTARLRKELGIASSSKSRRKQSETHETP